MHLSLAAGFLFLFFILGKSLAKLPPPDTPSVKQRFVVSFFRINREKSLRHVANIDNNVDNKPKRHLKSGFAMFQTSLILFKFI